MKIKDFVFATKVADAYNLSQLIGSAAYFIAGGTSTFFVSSKNEKTAIDINRLPIKGIFRKSGMFRIGAGSTINEIMKFSEEGWVLNRVASRFVNQQVRNISTIGGNIARIFYWSDFPVALRALEGNIKITTTESEIAKISEMFHNQTTHKNALKNSIIEYIEIPALTKGVGFGYSKETRTFESFSAATAAAFIETENKLIKDIRLAIGAVLPFPMRLFEIENSLRGKRAELSVLQEIHWEKLDKYKIIPREGMSLEYCKHLLKTKISDVICEAIKEAVGETND